MLGMIITVTFGIGLTAFCLALASTLGAELTSDLLLKVFQWSLIVAVGSIFVFWIHDIVEVHVEVKRRKEGA